MNRLLAKHWAVALVISLALNLFLGGLLAARWLSRPAGGQLGGRPMRLQSLKRQLDPAVHETLDRVTKKHEPRIHDAVDAAREARQDAMEALSAEDFDEARARAALADFRSKSTGVHEAVHEALLELAAALPQDQRASLGAALSKKHGKHGRLDKHRRRPPPAGPPPSAGLSGKPPPPGDARPPQDEARRPPPAAPSEKDYAVPW